VVGSTGAASKGGCGQNWPPHPEDSVLGHEGRRIFNQLGQASPEAQPKVAE